MKKIASLLVAILFMAISATVLGAVTGVAPVFLFAGLTATSFIPMPSGVSFMAIQKEIWINDIVANLFMQNPHLNAAYNADGFVYEGKVVHIPNAGTKPLTTKNRSTYPGTVITRTDVDITFSLDEFSSDPIKIANADKYELSYDKRASVMGAQYNSIAEAIGTWFFYYWAPTVLAQMARCTGTTAAATVGTGVRNILMLADIQNMQKLFNKQNIPQADRFAQLDADLYNQLLNQLNATTYRDFSAAMNLEAGVVGKLFGFTFLAPRSTVLVYDNSTTPIPYDPTQTPVAATANAAGLFWHKDSVIRALGHNDFFENLNDPLYYGDVYSTLVRAGGRIRRNDGAGVAVLVQA